MEIHGSLAVFCLVRSSETKAIIVISQGGVKSFFKVFYKDFLAVDLCGFFGAFDDG